MDLKTFVTETLCQIQEGVEDAIKRRVETGGGGAINPSYSEFKEATKSIIKDVTFDVAITASEGEEKGAKGGLRVAGIGIGLEGKGTKANEVVSRVQFVIPMVAPTTVIEQDQSAHDRRMVESRRAQLPKNY
jgi:hypothetical protein